MSKAADLSDWSTVDLIIAERAAHSRDLAKLDNLAFIFLSAADGDKAGAESMLDGFVELLFEGGCLSTWRCRIVLQKIREGL
jgi:hypothetical protein